MFEVIAVAALAVSSQVTEVTVYNDRAQVVRTAEVALEQGINTRVFENLPESVDSRGIQVEGSGVATVLGVRFKSENFAEVPKEAWKALYDKQNSLRGDEKAVLQKIERFKESRDFLKQISAKITHTAEKESGTAQLDPQSWSKMLGLYTEKSAEYDAGLRAAELELQGVRDALQQVQADLKDAGADTRKQRRVVEVDLEAPAAGKAVLKLSYMVRGPQWTPSYDIRVDSAKRSMEVNYFALVQQSTGEDWKDAVLKLSTANPGLGGEHPEMDPWRIRIAPRNVKTWDAVSSRSEKLGVSFYAEEASSMANRMDSPLAASLLEAEAPPVQTRPTAVANHGVSVVFEVAGKSTVDSDNVEHRVAVATVGMPANFRYSAVPKLDTHAYLKAKAANAGVHPFLAGKANVFLDGVYVATSLMKLVAPAEEFWVFLGADESVKVEHKLVKKYQSREGLTGRTVRHAFEYLMTVKNTHAVPEEMIVWDQLPMSESEGLEVKLLNPKYSKDTDELKVDDERRISWFKVLAPGEEWAIPLNFQIDAPADAFIDGLE